MTNFLGEYNAKVDDKWRVVLPAAFKSVLSSDPESAQDNRLVVRKENFSDCLEVFTYREWERQSEKVRAKLNPVFNRDHAKFWRAYMYNTCIVEPDAKLGRISLPKKLLELIGVNPEEGCREVVFHGEDYKIEIWAKDRSESNIISTEEFLSIAGSLSENI